MLTTSAEPPCCRCLRSLCRRARVKERVPNAGGRERRRCDHKAMVVPVLETRINSRGNPNLFVFVCYSGGYTYIDKMKGQSIHC